MAFLKESLTTKMSSCFPLSVSFALVNICSLKMVLSAGNSIDATNTVAYSGLICRSTRSLADIAAERKEQHRSRNHCDIQRADLHGHKELR